MFLKAESCKKCIIDVDSNIKKAINAIEKGGIKIAIVLNKEYKLVGTICDGDIRRALLRGLTLESNISKITQNNCIKVNRETTKREISILLSKNNIFQIPVLDKFGHFIGLEISDDLAPVNKFVELKNSALLMAGGKGLRLRPLTNNCPKPLLKINNKPILEIILEQCISTGIQNFYISVCYLSEKIIDYFGDGSKWGINIYYLKEDKPLGTAGALKLIPNELSHPLLIINGDVLTKINFGEIFEYHRLNDGDITICAREHILQSPYGVLEVDGINYKSIQEKPSFTQLVNAGIYIINPKIIDLIKKNQFLDMPVLIDNAKKIKKKIIVYPIHEYWLDIGKPELLQKALVDWESTI